MSLCALAAGAGAAPADGVVTLKADRAGQELAVTLGVNNVTFNVIEIYVAYDKTRLTPSPEMTEYLQPAYDAFMSPEGWMMGSETVDAENGVVRYLLMAQGEAGGSVLDSEGYFTAGSTEVKLLRMKFTVKDGAALYADSIKLGKSAGAVNGIVIATKDDDGIDNAGAVRIDMGAAAESGLTPGGTGEGHFGKKPGADTGDGSGSGPSGGGTGGSTDKPSDPVKPNDPAGAVNFSDTDSHWAKSSIETLVSRGIVNGYADGTFRPEASLTRAEFAAVLARAKDLKLEDTKESVFTDCAGTWSAKYVNAAYQAGYVNGTGGSSFSPDKNITREEIVTIIARAGSLPAGDASAFSDAPQIAPWAAAGVGAASKAGIVNGYPDGTFRPKADVLRGEMAKMVVTMLG